MTVHNAKSASVTNLDATPATRGTAGGAGRGILFDVLDYVTVPASAAATSVFRFVRLPSTATVRSLVFESEAQTAGKVRLGLYFADDARYLAAGSSNSGLVANTNADYMFNGAADIDCASAVTPIEKNLMSADKKQMPLWKAAGLTTDPGGFFDICATVYTTDVTTGLGKMAVRAVGSVGG